MHQPPLQPAADQHSHTSASLRSLSRRLSDNSDYNIPADHTRQPMVNAKEAPKNRHHTALMITQVHLQLLNAAQKSQC